MLPLLLLLLLLTWYVLICGLHPIRANNSPAPFSLLSVCGWMDVAKHATNKSSV